MDACARQLNVRHVICIAHTIDLIVHKSFNVKYRKLVTMFRSSSQRTPVPGSETDWEAGLQNDNRCGHKLEQHISDGTAFDTSCESEWQQPWPDLKQTWPILQHQIVTMLRMLSLYFPHFTK